MYRTYLLVLQKTPSQRDLLRQYLAFKDFRTVTPKDTVASYSIFKNNCTTLHPTQKKREKNLSLNEIRENRSESAASATRYSFNFQKGRVANAQNLIVLQYTRDL